MTMHESAPQRGYLYLASGDRMGASAAPGTILRIEGRGPPWLAVDHTLTRVVVTPWPGRLWLVEITDPISREEQAAQGSTLIENAGYTRAAAVRIVEEADIALLFGTQGAAVRAIIAKAHMLTEAAALALARARPPEAGKAYHRAWQRWLELRPSTHADLRSRDFEGMLAMPFHYGGQRESPIGGGLLTIDYVVTARARIVLGDAALTDDPDDPEGALLVLPWANAGSALREAALAFGTVGLMSTIDRDILSRAWRKAFGHDPL
jgi:hypothetical protein